jgi:amino acid transporter
MSATSAPRLRQTLRFGDVVLFLVVAVVAPRWIATAAAVGPSALAVWAIAFLAFFVPLGVTVLDLSRRFPDEGGIYVWTREAFGDFAGFLTAWMYWSSNLVYFPALLYFTAGNALYALGPAGLALSDSAPYHIAVSLAGLLLAFALNLVGLDVGKWLHNAGAIGTWAPIAMLIVAGGLAWARFAPRPRSMPPRWRPAPGSTAWCCGRRSRSRSPGSRPRRSSAARRSMPAARFRARSSWPEF